MLGAYTRRVSAHEPSSPPATGMAAPPAQAVAAVDTAWLRMDEPANLMQINGVLVLDEPVTPASIKEILRRRLLPIRRFRQRVVAAGQGAAGGAPRWEDDPDFDLDRHVIEVTLPAPGDDAALAAVIGDRMSTPLPADRPLWEFQLLQGYRGGCALLGRIHHAIGDGVALMLVLLSLTDLRPAGQPTVLPHADDTADDDAGGTGTGETADAPQAHSHGTTKANKAAPEAAVRAEALAGPETPAGREEPADDGGNPFTDLFCHPLRDLAKIRALADEISPELMRLLHKPVEALRSSPFLTGIGSVGSLGRLLGRPADPASAFKGPLGVPKLVAWSRPLSVASIKEIGRALGGSINDVLVSATAGGLRRYLERRAAVPRRLDLRAAMPVNLRPLGRMAELGNHFGLVFLALPLGIVDPLERLAAVRSRSKSLRRSAEPAVVYAILRALGRVPLAAQRLAVRIFATKATLVLTNVPGPRHTLYLAAKPIRDIFFWVPQSGHVGLGVSILSYNGSVRLGVATDAGLVPDPRAIVLGFDQELAELARLAGVDLGEAPAPSG
jgi:diacylglycerol O-acyltransferase